MKQETLIDAAIIEIREYSSDRIIWTKEPFSDKNTFVVRGQFCDFEEKTDCVIAYLKQETIVNELQENAALLSILDILSKGDVTIKSNSHAHSDLKETLNNYKALKESNEALIEAAKIGYLALSDIIGAADGNQTYSKEELIDLFTKDYNTIHDVLVNNKVITI